MRVDIADVCRCEARVRYRSVHGAHSPVPRRVRLGYVVGVGRCAVTDQLGEDRRAPAQGELPFLDHQRGGALAHHETVTLAIKRPRGAFGLVVAGRKGLHRGEPSDADRGNRGLASPTDHGVGPSEADRVESGADCVSRGGTRGHRAAVVTEQLPFHGDFACGHVGDHHGHDVRVDPLGTPADQHTDTVLQGLDAAYAGGVDDTDALGGRSQVQLGALDGFLGRHQRKLDHAVEVPGSAPPEGVPPIKARDLARDTHGRSRGIERGDLADPAPARNEALPSLLDVQAKGADRPHTSDDHPAIAHR